MRLEDVRYFVVEDREDALTSVLQMARVSGLRTENRLGVAKDLDSAMTTINTKWRDIDLILLDLNIPKNDDDTHLSKDNGEIILKLVHEDINLRGGHAISIIIVSGEVDSSFEERFWLNHRPTVIGLAAKNELSKTLPQCLQKLSQDSILLQLRRVFPEAQHAYLDLTDPNKSANDRSLAGLKLGCFILKSINAYEYNRTDAAYAQTQDLNSLIREYLQRNFEAPHYSDLRKLRGSRQKWILRGYMVEHLYSLLKYRNSIIHLIDTGPFHDGSNEYAIWADYPDVIRYLERADGICKILAQIAQDLLQWYLPWHEKVYLPWKQSVSSGGNP